MFRGDVKEECAKLIERLFEDAVHTPARISQIVEHQLQTYNYIFPSSSKASAALTMQGHADKALVFQRTKPYRNDRIISVISTLYFSGGAASFASHFHHVFPTFDGPDGKKTEVPIPMIALVGTAVSVLCSCTYT